MEFSSKHIWISKAVNELRLVCNTVNLFLHICDFLVTNHYCKIFCLFTQICQARKYYRDKEKMTVCHQVGVGCKFFSSQKLTSPFSWAATHFTIKNVEMCQMLTNFVFNNSVTLAENLVTQPFSNQQLKPSFKKLANIMITKRASTIICFCSDV